MLGLGIPVSSFRSLDFRIPLNSASVICCWIFFKKKFGDKRWKRLFSFLLHISSLLLSYCDCAVQVLLSRVFPLPAIVS
ncbi:hypothetical protein Peur_054974 [Populus x canadensis]